MGNNCIRKPRAQSVPPSPIREQPILSKHQTALHPYSWGIVYHSTQTSSQPPTLINQQIQQQPSTVVYRRQQQPQQVIIFGESKKYEEVFNDPLLVFSNMGTPSVKRTKTIAQQQPRQGDPTKFWFGRSQTIGATRPDSLIGVTQINEQEHEESKVFNLEDFRSRSDNNSYSPIERSTHNNRSYVNENHFQAPPPTIIDQRRSGLNIASNDDLIVEQRATSYFIQKKFIDPVTGQEKIILEPLIQEEQQPVQAESFAPHSQEVLSQGAMVQDSNQYKRNPINPGHEVAQSEKPELKHPLKGSLEDSSVLSNIDRHEVIPSAYDEEFEEINELDKSDEEDQSAVEEIQGNQKALQELGILKNRPKQGVRMVPSGERSSSQLLPSNQQFINDQMPSAQSDYRSAYADDTEAFKSAKQYNQVEEIKKADSLLNIPVGDNKQGRISNENPELMEYDQSQRATEMLLLKKGSSQQSQQELYYSPDFNKAGNGYSLHNLNPEESSRQGNQFESDHQINQHSVLSQVLR